jgi:fatty-acid desaturase
MSVYNVVGYGVILSHCLLAAVLAPEGWGYGAGALVGLSYLLAIWFFGGVYLAVILHMGISHRALDFNETFVKIITLAYNTAGIYIDSVAWVNRHRHHHIYADGPGDPNKLHDDGFWQTLYRVFSPYECKSNLATDAILKSWPFRLVSSTFFAVFANFASFGILWLLVRDWKYALLLWLSVRVCALYVNMIQNYWSHDRRFGTRRYSDDDNAMNIGDWLPVTATFSACLQNNHHHHPCFLRLSHDDSEYDFGFLVVRIIKALGLVEATAAGRRIPKDIPLQKPGF